MNFPDGAPVAWRQRRNGTARAERIAGPDLMPLVIDAGREHGLRHYLFGATPAVLDRLERNLLVSFPGAQIVGTSSPPFRAMNAPEEREAVAAITAVEPHIVWVGLGTPKQDLWMHRLSPDLGGVLAMGVGAAFDFISGNRPRAPMWMQASGLEWVHRMVHDPIKLAPRYAAANTMFIASTIAEVTARHGRGIPSVPVTPCACWSSTTATGAPSRAARTRSSRRRPRSCATPGVVVEVLSVESDEIAGWPAAKRADPARPRRVVARRAPGSCGVPIAGFRPGRRPLPQHLPAAQPGGAARGARRGCPRRPDAAQLPSALPGGDVPARRPGVRGLPRPRSRPGGRPRLLPLLARGHAPDRREGRAAQRDRHLELRGRHLHHAVGVRAQPLRQGGLAGRPHRRQVQHRARSRLAAARPTTAASCASRGSTPEKGVDVLLDAWGRAFPDGGERLRIVGSGELEADLRRRAEPLAGVEFTGQLPRERGASHPARGPRARRPVPAGTRCSRASSPRPTRSASRWSPRGSEAWPRSSTTARPGILFEPDDADGPRAGPAPPGGRPRRAAARLGERARREYERNLTPRATVERLLEIYAGGARRDGRPPTPRPPATGAPDERRPRPPSRRPPRRGRRPSPPTSPGSRGGASRRSSSSGHLLPLEDRPRRALRHPQRHHHELRPVLVGPAEVRPVHARRPGGHRVCLHRRHRAALARGRMRSRTRTAWLIGLGTVAVTIGVAVGRLNNDAQPVRRLAHTWRSALLFAFGLWSTDLRRRSATASGSPRSSSRSWRSTASTSSSKYAAGGGEIAFYGRTTTRRPRDPGVHGRRRRASRWRCCGRGARAVLWMAGIVVGTAVVMLAFRRYAWVELATVFAAFVLLSGANRQALPRLDRRRRRASASSPSR